MYLFLLLLLLVALPARADSIDFASGGSISAGTATVTGSVAAGQMWSVTDILTSIDDETTHHIQQGNLGHVTILTGPLSSCPQGFCFTGGGVDITGTNGGQIFHGQFTSGTVTVTGGNTFLNAVLPNGGTVEIESKSGVFSSNTVATTTTPEASSLCLLGSGLCSLFFLRRFWRGHRPPAT